MQRFHESHGYDIELTEDRTVAGERDLYDESAHLRTVFSEKCIKPGQTFTVKILESGLMNGMNLGLTLIKPDSYDGGTLPRYMGSTWSLDTRTCEVIQDRTQSVCEDLKRCCGKGSDFNLRAGDHITIALGQDQTKAFIIYNGIRYDDMFTDLPATGDLYVIISKYVTKIKIIQTDNRLTALSKRCILANVRKESIRLLPLPAHLKHVLENDC